MLVRGGTMVRTADLSDCGSYRWSLSRTWDVTKPRLGWVLLNPSTADGKIDDSTIRRCISFAERDGYGGIDVVNLFAWRATDPATLMAASDRGEDIVGRTLNRWPHRDLHVHRLVAAWGALPNPYWPDRIAHVVESWSGEWWCLGRTKAGQPRHPLYIRSDQPLVRWVSP